MTPHPYLRAFLAGIFVPVLVLPTWLIVFLVTRIGLQISIPIEQAMIFPMAVVPALFGLWNMAYLRYSSPRHMPIGLHGAVLPLIIAPAGALTAWSLGALKFSAAGMTWFGSCQLGYGWIPVGLVMAFAVYNLVWKHIIGYVNHALEIA